MTTISDRLNQVAEYPSGMPGALSAAQIATVKAALGEPTASPAIMRQAERLLAKALGEVGPEVSRRAALDGYGNSNPTFRAMYTQDVNLALIKGVVEDREPFLDHLRHGARDCVGAPIANAFRRLNGALERFGNELF